MTVKSADKKPEKYMGSDGSEDDGDGGVRDFLGK